MTQENLNSNAGIYDERFDLAYNALCDDINPAAEPGEIYCGSLVKDAFMTLTQSQNVRQALGGHWFMHKDGSWHREPRGGWREALVNDFERFKAMRDECCERWDDPEWLMKHEEKALSSLLSNKSTAKRQSGRI